MIAEPGLTPTLPEMVEEPVFVTVVPARTANGAAFPRLTVAVAADATLENAAPNRVTSDVAIKNHPAVMPWRSRKVFVEGGLAIDIGSSFTLRGPNLRIGAT